MQKKTQGRKRIFGNKKGAILDNIGQLIQGIVSILPKPVLFLLFLFILVSLSYVLSLAFNAFGVYCNSADVPVKLNANFLDNIALIGQVPDPELLGREALELGEFGISVGSAGLTECSQLVPAGTIYFEDDTAQNFTTPTWFYDGTFCTNCQEVNIKKPAGDVDKVCFGNVERKSQADKTLLQRTFCGGLGCEPPEHYYYDQNTNTYVCADETCAGITLGQKWDELLFSKGAVPYYLEDQPDLRNPSAEHLTGITCENLKPRFAVFGVDLFTYNIWIFITLIVILLWLWINFP